MIHKYQNNVIEKSHVRNNARIFSRSFFNKKIIDIFINKTLHIFFFENLCTAKESKSKDFVN